MHVMFIHPSFPAQFGHLALHLRQSLGWECTCVTSIDTTQMKHLPFRHINYHLKPGPLPKRFDNPTSLQDLMDHMTAIYKGLKTAPQIRPDLVVGHTSFGTLLYLRNLYPAPFVGYYELLPAPFWTDGLTVRREYPPPEETRLFNATFHALTYLHLHACDALYTPTQFQLGTAPPELQYKIKVIHDGVETEHYKRKAVPRPTQFRGLTIGPDTRVVTYVARGLESIRGFDIFMRVAARLAKEYRDILFLIAGEDKTFYGHEMHHLRAKSFKEYVLSQGNYDPEKFRFLGWIPTTDLTTLFNLSDLHFYLTVPYTLSWSLMQAMSNGCTVLGSDTAPVREVLDPDVHGLVADFYDVEGLTRQALRVLADPEQFRPLGLAARERIIERYEVGKCLTQLVKLFEDVASGNAPKFQGVSKSSWVTEKPREERKGAQNLPR